RLRRHDLVGGVEMEQRHRDGDAGDDRAGPPGQPVGGPLLGLDIGLGFTQLFFGNRRRGIRGRAGLTGSLLGRLLGHRPLISPSSAGRFSAPGQWLVYRRSDVTAFFAAARSIGPSPPLQTSAYPGKVDAGFPKTICANARIQTVSRLFLTGKRSST